MAHKQINGKVVVDWTTGDPEGDRVHVLSAYRDFLIEIQEACNKWIGNMQGAEVVQSIFEKWNVSTENQIDEIPRIWIKKPE